jgi:hypothetical protein
MGIARRPADRAESLIMAGFQAPVVDGGMTRKMIYVE